MINKLKELRQGGEEEGFTLIELMIVVVIIGILAAIAIPIFLNQQKSAIAAGIKSDVKNTVTNVATALVKAPTSDSIETIVTKVQGANTDIKIYDSVTVNSSGTITATPPGRGTWQSYVVYGKGIPASGINGAYIFDSLTGKYTGYGDIK